SRPDIGSRIDCREPDQIVQEARREYRIQAQEGDTAPIVRGVFPLRPSQQKARVAASKRLPQEKAGAEECRRRPHWATRRRKQSAPPRSPDQARGEIQRKRRQGDYCRGGVSQQKDRNGLLRVSSLVGADHFRSPEVPLPEVPTGGYENRDQRDHRDPDRS